MTPTTIAELGEFTLIDRLRDLLPEAVKRLPPDDTGIGDDAAIWTPPPGAQLVVTTDALVEGNHFRLDWTDWQSLGHKMLAVNLSDIAAMGATPRIATVVIGLTGRERVTDLEALYVGAGHLAEAHGVVLAGGDIVRTHGEVMLGVTLIGSVAHGAAIRRQGANVGDAIVVSGTLGASAAGLALLGQGEDTSATGPLLRAAQLRPNPRLALGSLLHAAGITAAMDLSDGLIGDLPKIARASGVGAVIDQERLPVLPAVRALFPNQADDFALRGGEDYELLMTIPPDRLPAFIAEGEKIGTTLTPIGEIVPGSGTVSVRRDGQPVTVATGAFDHFRRR